VFGVVSAGPAWADHASIHATGTGDVAVTDNVFAAPDGSQQTDMFFQLRPGVLLAYDSPRMIHEVIAELEVLEYLQNSDQPSLNFHGGWRGVFTPGPRSQALVGVNGDTGTVSALTARATPDQTTVLVQPAGNTSIEAANATEYASFQTSRDSSISETVVAQYANTDDHQGNTEDSFQTGLVLGFERQWKADSLGVQAGASFLRLERHAPMGAMLGDRLDRQVNPQLTVTYRHDFDRNWSANADAGAVLVNPIGTDPFDPTDMTKTQIYPVVGVQGSYTDLWGRAALSLRRAVSPNLLIAQNTITDGALAQVSLPLPWLDDSRRREPKLVAAGTTGFERTQLIDSTTSDLVGKFDVFRLDMGLAYTPHPGQTYGLRYEYLRQTGDSTATMVVPAFSRNTVFFTFTFRYPERLAVEVPAQRNSTRADHSDLSTVGEEPVVPEAVDEGGTSGGGRDND
jgi:hypothetical protein